MKLYDYNTASKLTAKDLGITEKEYREAVKESKYAKNEGVITVNGRSVYAQH
jgi:hypothetical protein